MAGTLTKADLVDMIYGKATARDLKSRLRWNTCLRSSRSPLKRTMLCLSAGSASLRPMRKNLERDAIPRPASQ